MSKLTASPFHPVTGDLLPVYLDIYLIGDLVEESMTAVTRYLRQHPAEAAIARERWQVLLAKGDVAVTANPPWGLTAPSLTHSTPTPPRSGRSRLSAIRLFAAGFGLLACTVGGYSYHLYHQQQQVSQAGPVFDRTESDMEMSSVNKQADGLANR